MNPSFQNVAVMGAGAVGCYFGAMLARGRREGHAHRPTSDGRCGRARRAADRARERDRTHCTCGDDRSGCRRRLRSRVVQREVIGDGGRRARDRAASRSGRRRSRVAERRRELRSAARGNRKPDRCGGRLRCGRSRGTRRPASQRPRRSCHRPASRNGHRRCLVISRHILPPRKSRRASPTISTASCGRSSFSIPPTTPSRRSRAADTARWLPRRTCGA